MNIFSVINLKLYNLKALNRLGDVMTRVCFVGVLDSTGSMMVFVPLMVNLLIGFAFLGLGFFLLLPIRRFVKQVLRTETAEMDKLAVKIGKTTLLLVFFTLEVTGTHFSQYRSQILFLSFYFLFRLSLISICLYLFQSLCLHFSFFSPSFYY
jgi:hypothetical protein